MKARKREFYVAVTLLMFVLSPLLIMTPGEAQTSNTLKPFTPHAINVLAVTPNDIYYSGGQYLVSDLARYGFNVTHVAADNATGTNYLTDPRTADLSQYQVVIIQGISGFSGARVSEAEVAHFTDNYRGVLILIGNALMQNETSNNWWGWKSLSEPMNFSSDPVRHIEQRLRVDLTGFAGVGGAWHNDGEFDLLNNTISGLPYPLSYEVPAQYTNSFVYQLDLTTADSNIVYDFTINSTNPLLIGKEIPGITYYKAQDNAVGIFIQGAYVYGAKSGTYDINYYGLTDISQRSSLLASVIAFASNRDASTIIKPQPLANVRLSGLGYSVRWDALYLNASLANFNSVVDAYNVTPTIAFAEVPPTFDKDYWQRFVPTILSELKSEYRDWEYSSALRNLNTSSMSQNSIETLIQNVNSNFTALGMDLFSTVATSVGLWNQTTLDALANKNIYLIDSVGKTTVLTRYSPDWWNSKIDSSVVVHYSARMAESYEDFAQMSMELLRYGYFSNRAKWALAVLNGFPSFAYEVPNFRWNEVGTYSLETVLENLRAEIPDVKFVPLIEAGLYFGNRWMRIENVNRAGNIVEFDVDSSLIPEVANIGKGMLWIRVNASDPIQAVSVDGNPWFYFDEHSIRIPASATSVHVKVTLGTDPSVRVADSSYKVVRASYDGFRFNVSITCPENLNASVRLFLPQIGPFSKNNWNIFTLEETWNYNFSSQNRILKFWAISDGFVSFEVGVFWIVDQSLPLYNSDVHISANFSGLELDVIEVTFSYTQGGEWINSTMVQENGLYNATIPAMRFGTTVSYRMFVYTGIGKWVLTEVYNYVVGDGDPPKVENFEWNPKSPSSDQPISVQISVSEPENASGVKEVVLRYYLGTDITGISQTQSIQMNNKNGIWAADIPGQSGGSLVTFYVDAYDNAGNKAETSHQSYTVLVPISPLLVAAIAGVVAVIAASVFLFVRRKRSQEALLKEEETKKGAENRPSQPSLP